MRLRIQKGSLYFTTVVNPAKKHESTHHDRVIFFVIDFKALPNVGLFEDRRFAKMNWPRCAPPFVALLHNLLRYYGSK
jgi:hypothetical protein